MTSQVTLVDPVKTPVPGEFIVKLAGTTPVPAVGQSIYGPGVPYGAKVEAGTTYDTLVMTMPTYDEVGQ